MNLESLDERMLSLQDAFLDAEHEARRKLGAVLDASLDAVLILDGNFCITLCNVATERIFGYQSADLIGISIERLVPLIATDEPTLSRLEVAEPSKGLRAIGECFPVETRVVRMQEYGKSSYVVLVRDVSERITMLEEIAHLNRAASMGQMAASIAHELAQPLAAILSNAQAGARFAGKPSPDLEEIRAALSEIIEDDQRASSVLQNMRAIFQKQKITTGSLDLNAVLRDVNRMLRNRALAKDVQIRLNLSSHSVWVLGDTIAVQEAVLNLSNNAIDALQSRSSERLLTLTSAIRAECSSGIIQVDDNGPGVREEHKTRLFEPFFTTKCDGLGLGLAICRSVIESLDGRVNLVERGNPGASFEVELPLIAPDSAVLAM